MKRICFCIDTLGRGGAERVMATLANMLSERDYEIFFVTNRHADNEYELNHKIRKITLSEVIKLSDYNCIAKIQQAFYLRKIFKRKSIEIGIAFMGGNNFALLTAGLFLPLKKIVSVRNDPSFEYSTFLHRLLYSVLFPTADRIIFQTNEEKKYFNKRIQSIGEIIMNPTADKFYHNELGGTGSDIVTVGRLAPQKNHKLLISAFAEIYNDYPSTNLIIYGEGELRGELEQQIDMLGLKNRVFLRGIVVNVERYICDAAMFVMCSNHEGMPNALMEAMALGLPVISTDCRGGGPAELIDNEINGILIECNNIKDLVSAMRRILDSKEERIILANNAKKKAKEFHENNVFYRWEKIINE